MAAPAAVGVFALTTLTGALNEVDCHRDGLTLERTGLTGVGAEIRRRRGENSNALLVSGEMSGGTQYVPILLTPQRKPRQQPL